MKKVGIITFHRAENYGAMLQAYALQKTLKKCGYESYIIDYRDKNIERKYSLLRLEKNGIKSKIREFAIKLLFFYKNLIKKSRYKEFIKNYYQLSEKEYKSESDLKDNYPKYDCYIAGSDQIWNEIITKGIKDVYTLNFGDKKINRITYAVSIGTEKISKSQQIVLGEKIKSIDKISVREESAKRVLSKITDKDIEISLDPTFLLNKREWEKLIKNRIIKEKYILVYTKEVNPNVKKIVDYISKVTNINVVHFDKKCRYNNELKNCYSSGPIEFLNLIKNAELIITNSFHGTAFSIIFEKEFFTIPDTIVGSRMTDLLKKLKLEDRMLYNDNELKQRDMDSIFREVNYNNSNAILKNGIEESMNYLRKSI
ncbi:MAG: polysaccharide pyruvyl transferase family protein [Clostridia bacterium]|nr:polysaccharide pyruvyl transferase family protein [Clostridia bacterium]